MTPLVLKRDDSGAPIQQNRFQSLALTTAQGASAVYNQSWVDSTWTNFVNPDGTAGPTDVNFVSGSAIADQAGTLYLDQTDDANTVAGNASNYFTTSIAVSASTLAEFPFTHIKHRWYRFRYVNGSTAQTSFILSQVSERIDAFDNVALLGSNNRFFQQISPTTANVPYSFGFNSKQVMVINDGSDNINFALDGNSSLTPTLDLYSDASTWTFNGTWSNYAGPPAAKYSTSTSATAVWVPNVNNINSVLLDFVYGSSAGIADIFFSSDGGTTWQTPSAITGISRSDGASGSALNTVDTYATSSAVEMSITYNLPIGKWSAKIQPSGAKNASSSGVTVFVRGAQYSQGSQSTVFIVKPGESLQLDVQTTQIAVSSPTSSTGRVIAV